MFGSGGMEYLVMGSLHAPISKGPHGGWDSNPLTLVLETNAVPFQLPPSLGARPPSSSIKRTSGIVLFYSFPVLVESTFSP